MARQKLSRLNVGNLLVIVGLGWLGFGFWLPYATSKRVYRIEIRASRIAGELCKIAQQHTALDWTSDASRDEILALVNAACGLDDPGSSRYLTVAERPRGVQDRCYCLQGKHYYYLLTNTPKDLFGKQGHINGPGNPKAPEPQKTPNSPITRIPFEIYAWPKQRDPGGGSRTVFFYATDARPAFTRNLDDTYIGLAHWPEPGAGRPDVILAHNDYRNADNIRWIYATRR